jgi:hypothetical protein
METIIFLDNVDVVENMIININKGTIMTQKEKERQRIIRLQDEFHLASTDGGIGVENLTKEHVAVLREWSECFDGRVCSQDTQVLFDLVEYLMSKT